MTRRSSEAEGIDAAFRGLLMTSQVRSGLRGAARCTTANFLESGRWRDSSSVQTCQASIAAAAVHDAEAPARIYGNESTRKGRGVFDIYVVPAVSLLVARLTGILDAAVAGKVIDFIEIRETLSERGFNRFCDMSGLEAVRVSSRDVFNLSARRRAFNPNDIPVKSAFRAPDPLAFGIARMYERMLNSPRIEVRVFADLKAAADWLGVSPDKLTI